MSVGSPPALLGLGKRRFRGRRQVVDLHTRLGPGPEPGQDDMMDVPVM
ncbi:hypothetical protein [Tabrizicola sp.]